MDSIELLVPDVAKKAELFISKLKEMGFKYKILETLRTAETQAAYYAQGREHIDTINRLRFIAKLGPIGPDEAKRVITHAKISNHQAGRALDIVPIIGGKIPWVSNTPEKIAAWKTLGEVGQSFGFDWGGAWKPLDINGLGWDLPHFEIKK